MNAIEAIRLPDVLGLISKPRYVLGTTYTLSLAFFESAVFPKLDRSQLKSCLIVCDALGYHNALTEAAALQGAAQDYMVVPAPTSGSFHAKVWIIVGDKEFVLLTGSGNLTQAGFINNAELFDALYFTADSPVSVTLLGDIRSFLKGLGEMWEPNERRKLLCVETLSRIEQALGEMPVDADAGPDGTRFLHSFQGQLIEQMPITPDAKELYVASPYFGDSLQGLDLVANRYPSARLNLFPAVHSGNVTNLPLDQLRKAKKSARISQLDFPPKPAKFAHLKLYGVAGQDGAAWIYCTSANCTQTAWQGPNIEAGLLRKVAPTLLKQVFVSGNADLPDGRLRVDHNQSNIPPLQCWATDSGEWLVIQMSNDDQPRFPLTDVMLTLRAGSRLATCHRPVLLHEGCVARLSWSAFEGWEQHRKVAVVLEVQGEDAKGNAVRSACLVENTLLLSADPSHRSAWRAAQALLDPDGTPEQADLAAIFSLATYVFDGNLIRLPERKAVSDDPSAKKEIVNTPVGIAVWPPQPDGHELHRRIDSTMLGQLQWFQKILQAFLLNPSTKDSGRETHHGHVNHSGDDEDDYEKKDAVDRLKEADENLKQAIKMWESAYRDYQRLRDKLFELCPTAVNAPNIWPAIVFAFLSIMATFRKAKRRAPDFPKYAGIEPGMMCDDFFRAMFNYLGVGGNTSARCSRTSGGMLFDGKIFSVSPTEWRRAC